MAVVKNQYLPDWESNDKKKRIFVILGPIAEKTYRKLRDIDYNNLLDNGDNQLVVERDYENI